MCTFWSLREGFLAFQLTFRTFDCRVLSLDENVPGESRTASHEILKTFQTFLYQNGVNSTLRPRNHNRSAAKPFLTFLSVFIPDPLVILNEDGTFKPVEKGILQKLLLEHF